MLLTDKTSVRWDEHPFVVRVSTDPCRPEPLRAKEALLLSPTSQIAGSGFRAYLKPSDLCLQSSKPEGLVIPLPSSLSYVADGDIMQIRPLTGDLRVIYRKGARHNSVIVTRACNNYCLMCAQPPRNETDNESADLLWDAIPLMDIDTPDLIFTGGEPTLLGKKLIELIRRTRSFLPHTALHILTNGRLFKYLGLAKDTADVHHPDLVVGIPLYSDVSHEHDFMVQSNGAFDDTVRGILNLARCGVAVELRIIVTTMNQASLDRFARFVSRSFPFCCNVAFMGLEPVGFAKTHIDRVWVDPVDYEECLNRAICLLDVHGIPASIYNHQLCTLRRELWRFARQSISDWKNVFLDGCRQCSVKHQCCGLFSSATEVHSRAIEPIAASTAMERVTTYMANRSFTCRTGGQK
jgi:His-Xaa-Ser system radical SAM maturase HxsC